MICQISTDMLLIDTIALLQVDLKHMEQEVGYNLVPIGIDLTDFYLSVEWDLLEVPASRNEEYYPCCAEPFSGDYDVNWI